MLIYSDIKQSIGYLELGQQGRRDQKGDVEFWVMKFLHLFKKFLYLDLGFMHSMQVSKLIELCTLNSAVLCKSYLSVVTESSDWQVHDKKYVFSKLVLLVWASSSC